MNPTVCRPEAVAELGIDARWPRAPRSSASTAGAATPTRSWCRPRNVVPRPAGRTWAECAAYPVAYVTAWRMLRRARVRAGETVLVVGIGGGVSTACLAIARHLGAEVHVTSRDPTKADAAIALGAVAAHDSAAERWDVEADVVVESVGPATWDQSIGRAEAGRSHGGGRRHERRQRRAPPAAACSSASTRSSARPWAHPRSSPRSPTRWPPASRSTSTGARPRRVPRGARAPRAGAQLGKIVLRHD